MLPHLLPEGQKGLSPESGSCRAKTNRKSEDGLGSEQGQGEAWERSVCMVCLWVQRLSPRTGEEHPETDALIPSDGSHFAHSVFTTGVPVLGSRWTSPLDRPDQNRE